MKRCLEFVTLYNNLSHNHQLVSARGGKAYVGWDNIGELRRCVGGSAVTGACVVKYLQEIILFSDQVSYRWLGDIVSCRKISADCRPTVGPTLDRQQSSVGRRSTDARPTLGRCVGRTTHQYHLYDTWSLFFLTRASDSLAACLWTVLLLFRCW